MQNNDKYYASIFKKNNEKSRDINNEWTQKNVLAINVLGSAGAGKTTVIENLILNSNENSFVIEADLEGDIDTFRLSQKKINAIQINTLGGCHLDAFEIEKQKNRYTDVKDAVLFIENIGNLVCTADWKIGEHIKILILSVTDGSDKPYKYPLIFENSDLILLNKYDLKPYVDFDFEFFEKGIRAINKKAPIFCVSKNDKNSFEKVIEWIKEQKSIYLK